MGEDKLGIELISKDATINTLLPIMSELSIDVDAQEKIVLAIMNQKIAYNVDAVVAEIQKKYCQKCRNILSVPNAEKYCKSVNCDIGIVCDIVRRGGVE